MLGDVREQLGGAEVRDGLDRGGGPDRDADLQLDRGRPVAGGAWGRAIFYVDDVKSEFERLKGLGVKFTMPATKVTGSTIAILDDTCGNLVQITALDSWKS